MRPAPAAVRQRRARLGDLRLWAGIGLLAGSALLGAMLAGGDDGTVTVWRATRDLAAGGPAVALEPVAVPPSIAAGYLRPEDDLGGRLRWPVAAGQLLPAGWLAVASVPDGTRRVTVPVDPLHAPVGLGAGDAVDVWVTPRSDSPSTAPAGLVLAGAIVVAVSADGSGLAGEVGVVLEVPEARVADVVVASRGGVLDLVAVPFGAQEIAP